MNLTKAFGDTIRELRKKAGLSQEKLSILADIDRKTVSFYESYQRSPNIHSIFALARAFNIKPEELIGIVRQKLEEKP